MRVIDERERSRDSEKKPIDICKQKRSEEQRHFTVVKFVRKDIKHGFL